jgi:hypothetical protein
MGPSVPKVEPHGPWMCGLPRSIIRAMDKRGLHRIEDDIAETWIEDWAGAGVAEIEEYLDKHAAFLRFLESNDA